MLKETIDPALAARSETLAKLCALMAGAMGLTVLTGWAFDIAAIKSVMPGWQTMKANSALAFVLAGISLASAVRLTRRAHCRMIQVPAAVLLTALAMLTVAQHLFVADFGIDQLLFADTQAGSSAPGRMAIATALGLSFTGLALLALDLPLGRLSAQVFALLGMLIGALGLLGYVYGIDALYAVTAYSSMAAHTAIGLLVVNLGILLARPDFGLVAILASRTSGGVMARRLLPLLLLAPMVVGWAALEGQRQGWFDMEFGVALITLAYLAIFAALIWRTAEVLRKSDIRRFAAERAERRRHAEVEGIVKSALNAIIMIDTDQRIVLFNPAAEEMFGYRATDVFGMRIEMLLPERYRHGHDRRVEDFDLSGLLKRCAGDGRAVAGQRANGEEFPAEVSVARVETNGEVFFTAIVRDISESQRVLRALAESEERERTRSEELAKLLDAVPVAVWFAHDPTAKLITGNRLSYEWLCAPEDSNVSQGLPERERVGGFRILRDGVEIPASQMPLQLAAAGMELRDYEFAIRYADGSERHLLGNAMPLQDEDGRPRGAISAFLDITARRRAELAMKDATLAAERANNAKSRFLAAASHDLRQPLSAMSLYLDLLRQHIEPEGERMMASLGECVRSLSELLTDLLDLSKLEAGVVTPCKANFPVLETLSRLVSIHAAEAHVKGLDLRLVSTNHTAYTDPVLYRRIVGNLISNAVRYTERGGVLVACRRRAGKLWVEVWDTGIGIPADKREEIFEEFRQLGDQARTRGSGLGLAIVAKTAALLGLEIVVRSWPGRGSVFAIELPPGRALPSAPARPVAAADRPLCIALVEDNPMVRDALVDTLRHAGHRVIGAGSGRALVAALDGLRPDVVVSDYRLAEGETGFDVIQAVRARSDATLPAILITGDTDPAILRSMTDRGVAVLHKPVSGDMLKACLADLATARARAVPESPEYDPL